MRGNPDNEMVIISWAQRIFRNSEALTVVSEGSALRFGNQNASDVHVGYWLGQYGSRASKIPQARSAPHLREMQVEQRELWELVLMAELYQAKGFKLAGFLAIPRKVL